MSDLYIQAKMRVIFAAILMFFSGQFSFGQLDPSRVIPAMDSTKARVDALQSNVSPKVDSTENSFNNGPNVIADTVSAITHQLDSIQHNLESKIDSITQSYTKALGTIQSSAQRYQSKIDSLQNLNLPTGKYMAKMDSLSQKLTSVQQDMDRKLESLKKTATDKIKSIQYPPELEDKVSKLTGSIGNLNLKTIETTLPSDINLDRLNNLKNSFSLNGMAGAKNLDIPALQNVNGLDKNIALPDVKSELGDVDALNDVSNINGKAEALQGKISETTKDLNPNSIDTLAESKASQLKEVKALQEASGDIPLDPTLSEKEMKAKLKEQARKVAVDHFAGKEQQLKAAMEKISKYKQKYSNVKSIADISKKPRNEMKDKPFVERIIPGLGMQVQKKGDDLLVDFNPYVGYRFTTRITAGAGWNERVPYDFDLNRYDPDARVYGPRLFGEFKIGKGFSPRFELEVMNTVVPPSTQVTPIDPENRQWVWGAFVGIKKEYKLIKRVKGTASVMTRLFNPDHKSPYADVLNVRFGFEFPMKKKIIIRKLKSGSGLGIEYKRFRSSQICSA